MSYNCTIGESGSSATPITLHAPLTVNPGGFTPKFSGTVNGGWVPTDIANANPTIITIDCRSIAFSGEELNQLWDWYINRTLLEVEDEATGSGLPNAYFYSYKCYIMQMPESVMSPFKMNCESFNIVFAVTEVTGRLT